MSAPILHIDGVKKRFGAVQALDGVTLDIAEGAFFALLGPSGCGKTTLLRTLAGFETPDAGRVLLDGDDITRLRPARRPVNLMFQSYALFPHMTVTGNIAYGLEMERRPRAETRARVADAMATVRIADLASRRPAELSGGQKQRVALARALVKRPRVLLLDEPLAALDRKLREEMQGELKRLQLEVGITFVIVTHDQDEALALADRIAVMDRGRVAQEGTPEDLYERPASRFVAGFVGAMNFLYGTMRPGGVEVPGLGLLPARGAATGAATLAVRPERVRVTRDRPAGFALPATVREAVYRGAGVTLGLALADGAAMILARLGPADLPAPGPGAAVWCAWDGAHARAFAEGEERTLT